MKELQNHKENEVQIVAEEQQRKEVKFLGSKVKRRGMVLWELDIKTKTLEPAKYKAEDVAVTSLNPSDFSTRKHLKVEIKEGCYYLLALNRKNALKKLRKM